MATVLEKRIFIILYKNKLVLNRAVQCIRFSFYCKEQLDNPGKDAAAVKTCKEGYICNQIEILTHKLKCIRTARIRESGSSNYIQNRGF